jgi:hypothetical protein
MENKDDDDDDDVNLVASFVFAFDPVHYVAKFGA